jgi:hypothetical protein
VERGSFRPVTKLTLDILERARESFLKEPGVEGNEPVVLAEMSLNNLSSSTDVDHSNFLARADILGALGFDVLVSSFEQDYQVADYLATYTDKPIAFAIGLPTVRKIVEEQFYTDLSGGALEASGRLFKRSVKAYVYPARDPKSGRIETIDDMAMPGPWQHLRRLLSELGRFQSIHPSDESLLSIDSRDVLARIMKSDNSWESMVPAKVVEIIKSKHLFGAAGIEASHCAEVSLT